jgi:DNA-binding protein YbaB
MFDKIKMLQQAKAMQQQMEKTTLTEEANGISITVNGKQQMINIEIIDTDLLQDKEKLEKSILDTFNIAANRSQMEMAKKMQSEMGGLF